MKCEGKTAIVTGGGRGIGRAIALALADEGATVAVIDLDEENARHVVHEITENGGQASSVKTDVSKGGEVQAAVDRVLETWGTIDILVNNAGICPVKAIEEITEGEWDKVLAVNLKGVFLFSQAVLPIMKRQQSGSIINIASVAGRVGGIASGVHYSASKAGVISLTKSFARALAPYQINVNAIAPAATETDMLAEFGETDIELLRSTIPMGRLGRPEELGQLAVYLASEEASFITGATIDINGGQFMA